MRWIETKLKGSVWLLAMSMFLVVATAGPSASSVDHSIFGSLLGKYNHDGIIDYKGFKNEESRLDAYLDLLQKTDSGTLAREEQFAFYVNAYNAWTIKLILSGYPGLKSIKDLGSLFKSPWKKKIVKIDGGQLTLDQIEHEILRKRYKDARIHFAVNCASKSCPPLLTEPFNGARLDQQLEAAARAFINDPQKNYIKGRTLYVSKIFKWFSADFNDDPVSFFLRWAKADLKQKIQAQKGNIKLKYLEYDWSLNGE